jgi:hypothetical protein
VDDQELFKGNESKLKKNIIICFWLNYPSLKEESYRSEWILKLHEKENRRRISFHVKGT